MHEPYQGAGSEALNDMHKHTADVLEKENHQPQKQALKVARLIVDRLRHAFGGQMIYFPKGTQQNTSERDQLLYAEFNGKNHSELAKKFGLSLQAVYARIRTIKKLQSENPQ